MDHLISALPANTSRRLMEKLIFELCAAVSIYYEAWLSDCVSHARLRVRGTVSRRFYASFDKWYEQYAPVLVNTYSRYGRVDF